MDESDHPFALITTRVVRKIADWRDLDASMNYMISNVIVPNDRMIAPTPTSQPTFPHSYMQTLQIWNTPHTPPLRRACYT